jgi:hypothetical protein
MGYIAGAGAEIPGSRFVKPRPPGVAQSSSLGPLSEFLPVV